MDSSFTFFASSSAESFILNAPDTAAIPTPSAASNPIASAIPATAPQGPNSEKELTIPANIPFDFSAVSFFAAKAL